MRRILVLTAIASFLSFAALAGAAEGVDRASYKAAVEPICETNTKANERILKGVRGLVQKGKLKPAATKFQKAGEALKKAHKQLLAVPQPTEDEPRLATWLKHVKIEADLFGKVAAKLRANKKGAAQNLVNQLTTNANKANAQVLVFGFKYCKFEPAKFS